MIESTVNKLADYQEAHPEEVLDVAPVMEKLDIARDMMKSGEHDDALTFAKEAEAEADKLTAPKGPKRVAVKKKVLGGNALRVIRPCRSRLPAHNRPPGL